MDNGSLTEEENAILNSYYAFMPDEITAPLKDKAVGSKNYVPIGSWYNIPEAWRGKEQCFPMLVDTIVAKYEENLLQEFLDEAGLFGYDPRFLTILDYVSHISEKQRQILFDLILDSLAVFRKKSIRERTSLSDFHLTDLKGEAVTVYSVAESKDAAFMTTFFLDMLLSANLNALPSARPLLFVIDDFEMLPKIKMIKNLMNIGIKLV